jgi:hypothetical protein
MLTQVVGECWHALARDVLALGYRREDMFTTLDLADMVSIVVGAPPGSAVRHWLDQGWSRTDHLLANLQEQQAGYATLPQAYERPGLEARPEDPLSNARFFPAEVITWEEADRRDKARNEYGKLHRGGRNTRVRTI